MISIVTAGRDDDYGVGFLSRLRKSMESNISLFEKYNLDYEYIICEWNPIKEPLCEHVEFVDLFGSKNVVDLLINKTVVESEGLRDDIFYEYFAKNAGIRHANGDIVLILNSDIVLTESAFCKIKELVDLGLSDDHYYRILNREEVNNDLSHIASQNLNRQNLPDTVICGVYSGDFLLINKSVLVEKGQGYDESTPLHRTISQTAMDGEILWNLYNAGVTIQFIDDTYQHINHGKPNPYDGHYNQSGYTNKSDWGFVGYTKEQLKEKLFIIK